MRAFTFLALAASAIAVSVQPHLAQTTGPATKDELRKVFKEVDTSGDKLIDAAELLTGLRACGFKKGVAKAIVNTMDKGDPNFKGINKQEFVKGAMEIQAALSAAGLDVSNPGSITKAQFMAVAAQHKDD